MIIDALAVFLLFTGSLGLLVGGIGLTEESGKIMAFSSLLLFAHLVVWGWIGASCLTSQSWVKTDGFPVGVTTYADGREVKTVLRDNEIVLLSEVLPDELDGNDYVVRNRTYWYDTLGIDWGCTKTEYSPWVMVDAN